MNIMFLPYFVHSLSENFFVFMARYSSFAVSSLLVNLNGACMVNRPCLFGGRPLVCLGFFSFFSVVHLLCLFNVVHVFISGHGRCLRFMWGISVAFSIPA